MTRFGCDDGCGASIEMLPAESPPGWTYLEISRRWRCPECSRALNEVNGYGYGTEPNDTTVGNVMAAISAEVLPISREDGPGSQRDGRGATDDQGSHLQDRSSSRRSDEATEAGAAAGLSWD